MPETDKTLKQHLRPYIFQEYNSEDETDEKHQMFYIDDVLKAVKAWVIQQRTCAMIFEKSGLSIHLISKKQLLENLK
jgi:hypothetical protein